MINATMCFLRDNGQTLFLHRHAGKGKDRHHGYFLPPGGRFERNERGIDCITREFQEETELTLLDPRLRMISTFYNKGRKLGGEDNPDDWQVEVYEASGFSGDLKSEYPEAEPIWIPDSEIKERRIYPGDRMIMALLDFPGIYQTIAEYNNEDLIRFDSRRVF